MGKTRLVEIPVERIATVFAYRHEKHVPVIQDSCTAEMGMGKPKNGIIRIVVAGASFPSSKPRVGTELDHTERGRGARESMARVVSAYKGIDVIGRHFYRPARAGTQM